MGNGYEDPLVLRDVFSSLNIGGHPTSTENFTPLWTFEFNATNAYEVWDRTTDPLSFDIVEPR
jgi:hypothetical protein